ncbi:hypothetical protein NKJ50_33235, partial [Mesorhizobium sp. M0115]|uniref:hypothetical protein n=1 Tax=Mesorhizobium sp. M0115 TaxID=2956883 RepID=UPI0033377498
YLKPPGLARAKLRFTKQNQTVAVYGWKLASLRFLTFDLTCAPASAPSAGATNSNTVVEPMLSITVIQAQALPVNPVVTNDLDGQQCETRCARRTVLSFLQFIPHLGRPLRRCAYRLERALAGHDRDGVLATMFPILG